MLERELDTYKKNKAILQSRFADGGFVVIKDEEILGVWQTRVDALRAGFEKYGNTQFLVKDIMEKTIAANFSKNLQFA